MKCKYCSYLNKGTSKFCTKCGNNLTGKGLYRKSIQIFFSIISFLFFVTGSFFSAVFTICIILIIHPNFEKWIGIKEIKFVSKIIIVIIIFIMALVVLDTEDSITYNENIQEIKEENISSITEIPKDKLINETLEEESIKTSCIAKFLEKTKCQSNAIMKEFQKTNCKVTWAYYGPCDTECQRQCPE